mmetsp:Transcript_76154/g.143530  ORF Transcript_76154/g.143530 Transcript_76154/m.143530 type:complete len:317 (-) Transcript_76154:564-1514(-)
MLLANAAWPGKALPGTSAKSCSQNCRELQVSRSNAQSSIASSCCCNTCGCKHSNIMGFNRSTDASSGSSSASEKEMPSELKVSQRWTAGRSPGRYVYTRACCPAALSCPALSPGITSTIASITPAISTDCSASSSKRLCRAEILPLASTCPKSHCMRCQSFHSSAWYERPSTLRSCCRKTEGRMAQPRRRTQIASGSLHTIRKLRPSSLHLIWKPRSVEEHGSWCQYTIVHLSCDQYRAALVRRAPALSKRSSAFPSRALPPACPMSSLQKCWQLKCTTLYSLPLSRSSCSIRVRGLRPHSLDTSRDSCGMSRQSR